MVKSIKMIGFALWMYVYIISLWPYYARIRKFNKSKDIAAEIDAIRRLQHTWGSGVLKHFGVRLHITGLENIPKGPILIVSNHQSYADIPIVTAVINRQAGFVAKAELARLPIFGKWIIAVRSVFIERNDARASLKAIEAGIALLEQGFSLGVFPEGTRSKGPQMGDFKKGSLKLATKTGVPVVPIAISGSFRSFEENGYPTPTEVHVCVMPAVETKNITKEDANNLTEKIEKMINDKLMELQSS
jgi:1-acyl-sn-glycerol-3-phosphate acyltransferase